MCFDGLQGLLSLTIIASRYITVRRVLNSIPKAWIPICPEDVPKVL